MLKKIGYLFLLIIFLIAIFGAMNWHSDIPMKTLKEKYEYGDSKYLNMDGMAVHYRDIGQGQPLVLIHGTAASLHCWEDWIPHLKDHFRIVAVDLPAFGLTGKHPKGDYSMDSYLTFMDHFMTAIGLEDCYMAGNSFGGRIAWNYALEKPGKVKKMALLDPSGYPSDKASILGFEILKNPIVERLFTKISPKFLIVKSVKEAYGDQSIPDEQEKQQYFDMLLGDGKRKALMEKMKIPLGDSYKKIAKIEIPTLVVWGDRDIVVDPGGAEKFHADLPNSELIIYKNVGHCPMQEIPEKSAKDVLKFFKKMDIQNDQAPLKPVLNEIKGH